MEPEMLPDESEEIKEPFVPSPVSRRIWAWMAIVYVVIATVLFTYWIATTTFIRGITGIMLFPLLAALCAQGVNNYVLCKKDLRPGKPGLLLGSAVIMGLIALSALVWGITQLLGGAV